jgi:peptidyl-prolyl cis-trans isomerase B (cyclophilin B)
MPDALPRAMAKKEGGLPVVRIQTNKGAIDVELFQKDAPKTVENFLKLSKQGFYNGLHWHRVIDDFMVQGGCPNSRTKGDRRAGTGGPGYTFADETRGNPRRHGAKVLSMANAGPNTNGSQFFITHSPQPHLDGKHTVFGHVIAGENVVDAIRAWDDITTVTQIEG